MRRAVAVLRVRGGADRAIGRLASERRRRCRSRPAHASPRRWPRSAAATARSPAAAPQPRRRAGSARLAAWCRGSARVRRTASNRWQPATWAARPTTLNTIALSLHGVRQSKRSCQRPAADKPLFIMILFSSSRRTVSADSVRGRCPDSAGGRRVYRLTSTTIRPRTWPSQKRLRRAPAPAPARSPP